MRAASRESTRERMISVTGLVLVSICFLVPKVAAQSIPFRMRSEVGNDRFSRSNGNDSTLAPPGLTRQQCHAQRPALPWLQSPLRSGRHQFPVSISTTMLPPFAKSHLSNTAQIGGYNWIASALATIHGRPDLRHSCFPRVFSFEM